MIVLRLTVGAQVHRITLPKTEVLLGAAPTADVTLQNAGWTDEMARCRLTDRGLVVERCDGIGSGVLLNAGQCMAVGDAILEWLAPVAQGDPSTPVFGGYEHDARARPRSSIAGATFEIDRPAPAPTTTGPTTTGPTTTGPTTTGPTMPAPPPAPTPAAPAAATPATPPSTKQAPAAQVPAAQAPAMQATTGSPAAATAAAAATAPPPSTETQPPVGFPEPDLGAELMAALKRAPYFAASMVVHAVVIFLVLLMDTSEEPEPTGLGTMRSTLSVPDDDPGDLEELEESLDIAKMDFETQDLMELLELPKPEPATTKTPDSKTLDAELDELTHDTLATPDIGVLPSQNVLRGKTRKRFRPTVAPSKLSEVFDGGGAARVNRRVAELVRNMVGTGGRGGRTGAGLDDLRQGDLLVVAGTFDHIQVVLRSLRLPFRKVAPYDLVEADIDFHKYKVVFWNCGRPIGPRATRKIKRRLQRFVSRGGYLFSTDWAVGGVLKDVFPGYLVTKGRKLALPERVVDIQPLQASKRNPLLEGVFQPGSRGRWWLEDQSFDIEIGPRGKDKVEVLIEAPELRDVYDVSPAVAVTFAYGRGRVLHLMGHYYQQAGNVAGTLAAHRLAMNFVLQKMALDNVK